MALEGRGWRRAVAVMLAVLGLALAAAPETAARARGTGAFAMACHPMGSDPGLAVSHGAALCAVAGAWLIPPAMGFEARAVPVAPVRLATDAALFGQHVAPDPRPPDGPAA